MDLQLASCPRFKSPPITYVITESKAIIEVNVVVAESLQATVFNSLRDIKDLG